MDDGVHACSLDEFIPYFQKIVSFSYRHYLQEIDYQKNSGKTKQEWDEAVQKSRQFARNLVKDAGYNKWIRFLRKIIELHEAYTKNVQIIIREEIKRYIVRTVRTIRYATDYDFKRICDDVCGSLIKRFDGVGCEDGVHIYPRMLEDILADEEWDLRRYVKRRFEIDFKDFNKSLVEEEKIPEHIGEELFEEFIKEPEGAALAAIRKINNALNIPKLYPNTDIWGGINELARSVEVYGRKWFGGKHMENILNNLFSLSSLRYADWKKQITGKAKFTDVSSSEEFVDKLSLLLSDNHVPCDKRLGRHILLAHLTRNYTSHHKGLTGKVLRKNLENIYNGLINTIFVFYAAYRNQQREATGGSRELRN